MSMFKKIPAPVKGGLVRDGMSTRLYVVVDVFPDPYGREDTWLCAVRRAGRVKGGVWHPPSKDTWIPWTDGDERPRWKTVKTSRGAANPVIMGSECPTPPPSVLEFLSS